MVTTVVLACSIALQLAAALMAFRLIRLTGRRTAWGLISAALVLMSVRRVIPFYHLLTGDPGLQPDPLNELIGLMLSLFMAVGIAGIGPFFLAAKRSEDALRESEATLKTIFNSVDSGILLIDPLTHTIVDANPAAVRLFEGRKEDIVGAVCHRYFATAAGSCPITDLGQTVDNSERVLIKADKRTCPVIKTVTPVRFGKHSYLLESITDITALKETEAQLRNLSLVDELTGLYNRRGFFMLAEQQMKLAERAHNKMILFFVDLDDMKRINDTLGHQAGDRALAEVAAALKKTFRESDIIGRMGGDEFAILALDTIDETREALRQRLDGLIMGANGAGDCKLSLSIGIAHYCPESPATLDELMTRADGLMYAEKRKKQYPAD